MKTKDLCTWMFSHSSAGRSISWWLCRVVLLQQRILDELSSSLYNLLQVFKKDSLFQFGVVNNVINYWDMMLDEKEAVTIVSMVQIEAGLIEYHYGCVDSSRLHFMNAAEAFAMDISVTGVLGFRTVHQADAKPQLVLVTCTGRQANADGTSGSSSPSGNLDTLDDNIIQRVNSVANPVELSQVQPDSHENKLNFQPHGRYECDILMTPRLVQNANSDGGNGVSPVVGSGKVLTAIQQAIILALCLHHQRSRRDDELSRWEMAPYIEAIDSQHKCHHMIRFSCDIMRIRWESTRSRTKQRALLMMDKLVKAINESFPVAALRMQVSFGIYIPTIPSLRKEYGELSLGCGMVGEALKIFEDLELWDNLIYCYRLLDKRAAAVDLINARLRQDPRDPKLWCSLGDVTNNDSCYEKALEVSNNKSARAMRSLARSAYNKGDYEKSKSLWVSAMALNSLYPDGWFALGAAALKARDIERAVDGFTRAVQLDPENGEAWNNIACLHMINKKSKPAFIAFKEALKFRRNNWQMWENFSHVALDVCNLFQALEATKMVLDLSSNKRVDIELLEKIMTKTEEDVLKASLNSHATKAQATSASQDDSIKGSCKDPENVETNLEEREWDMLLAMIGDILQQVKS
ncbi:putative UDP-N-acetylglucosamine--peptide N-acetylglucosaminyltransferase SPINDLY [Apostasia shenzhenica]|uniref:Putative UDP-N-acetylglucosamine--peptide N-acetylglucosaminyltransferase SPINDLY n=1 Tax=Apostasia shenzhenica TaxID=1088818 RepID=A0A2I0B8F6_9ASPA|nr:putative UDP-N-acetylglucosamine--peptide N-acetylglucosaminyltransferase SPINDLY [Apostasia shenzhenica]